MPDAENKQEQRIIFGVTSKEEDHVRLVYDGNILYFLINGRKLVHA